MQHSTADPGLPIDRSARNICDGFGTSRRPVRRHLEHAKLAGRAEPVLERAHDAMRMMALALEIQDGIDDVLERLGPGEIAVLRDVSDQHDRHVAALRGEQQMRRDFAHLADAAGGGLKPRGEDRLNRIDDHERGLEPFDLLEDALEARFGEQIQRRAIDREPLAAQLDLVLRLLARAVEDRAYGARDVRRDLQQQRRLSDTRLAAEQHERAGDDAAPEDAIELGDARRNAWRVGGLNVAVELCRRAAGHQAVAMACRQPARFPEPGCSSTSEFQAPQSGQRPSHLGCWPPHSWQTKTVFGGFTMTMVHRLGRWLVVA